MLLSHHLPSRETFTINITPCLSGDLNRCVIEGRANELLYSRKPYGEIVFLPHTRTNLVAVLFGYVWEAFLERGEMQEAFPPAVASTGVHVDSSERHLYGNVLQFSFSRGSVLLRFS